MNDTKVKSINALMKHLRNKKLNVSGSKDKNNLRNIGYYHGYKGYRFYNKANNAIPFTDFSELKEVYDFDMKLKSWFYPHIMFLETALKNRVLEFVLDFTGKSDFNSIYTKALNCHTAYTLGSGKYKEKLKDKINLRKRIYEVISQYVDSPIVQHFSYKNQMTPPLWGVFEFITLGEFGRFYDCLNVSIKLDICKSLNFKKGFNTSGELLSMIIYAIKDLRNAIAHNSPIFDVRFKTGKISTVLFSYLESELSLPKPTPYYGHTTQVNFEQIIDYFLLIIYLLKQFRRTKIELKRFIRDFKEIFEELKTKISAPVYKEIVSVDIKNKLLFLQKWV